MIKLMFSLLLMFSYHIALSQISGMWHHSYYDDPFTDFSMKLKGNAKSWTMTKSSGESRTITFDENGAIASDTYTGTIQTFISPEYKVYKLKIDLEKSYPISKKEDRLHTYNDRMQLLKRKEDNYFEKNSFDDARNILTHQLTYSATHKSLPWNSTGESQPIYKFKVNTMELAFFKYNNHGSLVEISYFNSDPYCNLRMVYLYDENNNMVETNRYDHHNVGMDNKQDNYLAKIKRSKINTNFSIEKFYPKYWSIGKPSVCKWKYNDKGQKIENIVYGYVGRVSFIAKWEYDEQGNLEKEIHYDVSNDRINRVMEFDDFGNVIKETNVRYDGKDDLVSEIRIVY